jgi:cell wall-associated NlpC family hydrolase
MDHAEGGFSKAAGKLQRKKRKTVLMQGFGVNVYISLSHMRHRNANDHRLRFGRLAPSQAAFAVKRAIWAAKQLRFKPFRYGGGHASFRDNGYDCSGTASYALGGPASFRRR